MSRRLRLRAVLEAKEPVPRGARRPPRDFLRLTESVWCAFQKDRGCTPAQFHL
jgi:hypothetical protein